MTRKWFYVLPVALVFVMACATTDTAMDDPYGTTTVATGGVEPAVESASAPAPQDAPTYDPIGPPPRIESPIGQQFPSSVTGGSGNVSSSGLNTNLNPPPPVVVETRESTVVVTETPIVVAEPLPPPPPPVIVEAEPVPEPEPVREMITKD